MIGCLGYRNVPHDWRPDPCRDDRMVWCQTCGKRVFKSARTLAAERDEAAHQEVLAEMASEADGDVNR